MARAFKNILKNSFITLALIGLATFLGTVFIHFQFQETNVVVTYILSVLLVSLFTRGYVYGILASISSLLLFNWFFTDPYFTLKVNNPTYLITFLIMTFTAVITSTLTTKVKEAARISKESEAESNALYKMTNMLTDAENANAIASISVKTVSDALSCDAAFVCYSENGMPENSFIQQKKDTQIRRELNNGEELKLRMEKLHATYDIDNEFFDYPVYGSSSILGILRLPREAAAKLTEAQLRVVHSVIESTALALERLCSLQAQARSREEATQEHYRSNLLHAISHDIRTPLSGIMGNVEMLLDMTDKEDPRYAIAFGVYQDADWLHSLVENILNLTKLHDGHLNITKEPEPLEEVVAASVRVIEKRFPDRNIGISLPDTLTMVSMNPRLISQVLINLLDNAVKHTPEGKEISVSVSLNEKEALFVVADRGRGIRESDLPNIFQMFYTTRKKSVDSERGLGLGLSICQSIVEAHGGRITAKNRENGGAEFSFTLPLSSEGGTDHHEKSE